MPDVRPLGAGAIESPVAPVYSGSKAKKMRHGLKAVPQYPHVSF
ncbi:MAG: hypothetical protein P4L92_13135 [Rudaea sp.]|nr:hypothetical protein [Rudaea sp.]